MPIMTVQSRDGRETRYRAPPREAVPRHHLDTASPQDDLLGRPPACTERDSDLFVVDWQLLPEASPS